MKIIQATFGVFHHFELARELDRRGHLDRIYSTYPWKRLQREGLPRQKVETFPWVHTPRVLLESRGLLSAGLKKTLGYRSGTTFDNWIARRIPSCDALISLSGSALRAGKLVQSRGGRFICDRGSTHRSSQAESMREEYRRWGLPYKLDETEEEAREWMIYAAADAIVVPSEVARRSFLERGHDPSKVHAIPYGVRLENFKPQGEPPRDSNATFEVLFVGGVSLRKGIPYLLKAFSSLKHPRKRLRIVGSMSDEIRPLLRRLPQEHVEFVGSVPQSELASYMSTSHVLVLPSIEDGFGLVVPQAMACGCPVIVSTNAGASDLIEEGVEGFVTEARDVEAMTASLERLAGDPQTQARMGSAARERIKRMGGWRDYGDRWESLLHTITDVA